MSLKFASTFVFAAAALALVAPAAAASTRTVNVSYADLDLSTGKGQRALKDRVRKAIIRVCNTGQRDGVAAREFADCERAAKANSKAELATLLAGGASGGGSGTISISSAVAER